MKTRIVVLSLVVLAAGCVLFTCRRPDIPEKYREFVFELDYPEQVEEFGRRPLDEQLDLYLIEMRYRRPPPRGYARMIAARGSEAVPFVLERLQRAERHMEKVNTILVLSIIATDYDSSIASDPTIISVIRNSIESLEKWPTRDRAEGYLEEILAQADGSSTPSIETNHPVDENSVEGSP